MPLLVWLAIAFLAALLLLVLLLALRIILTRGAAPLEPWHTHVPVEPDRESLERLDWAGYVAAEDQLLASVEREITERLHADGAPPSNRYIKGSPVHPQRFEQDWNRSFVLTPDGPPKGAAVLLHGLTDSPYSLRHIARTYAAAGWLALAIRLPGQGTVPGGLARMGWKSWAAATGLAVRAARQRVGETAPLHLVGYSNGAALALDHALRALDDPALGRPARLILLSPMIGITVAARFAGIAGWPAIFPRWARTAWVKVLLEDNPFKYNSLPVNAARQSYLVTRHLQRRLERLRKAGRLIELPPLMTFQSIVDATVRTDAVIHGLHAQLPHGTNELVLFDINRSAELTHLIRPKAAHMPASLLPPAPRGFRTAVVTNRDLTTSEVVERVVEAGAATASERPLDLAFPAGVFSLSHIALPFPPDDELYGYTAGPAGPRGIGHDAMASLGERNVLIVTDDAFERLSANPFFAYLIERLEAAMAEDSASA